MNVTGDLELINLDQFNFTKKTKNGTTILEFCNGDKWVSLTKQADDFLAPKTLIDWTFETPLTLVRSFKAATKLKHKLLTNIEMETVPLVKISSLAENIHVKIREASQNTDLDIREFLGIYKTLHSIQGRLINDTWTLTEIDDLIKEVSKRLEEVDGDPISSKEQRRLYRDTLEVLNTERQVRFEFLSQNWRELQTQVARIKQTIKKVLDKDASLIERILTLFREQGFTIFSIINALSMTILITVFTITSVFREGGGSPAASGSSSPKDDGIFNRLSYSFKRLAREAVEVLPAMCYGGKCCWCHIKFSQQSYWICS